METLLSHLQLALRSLRKNPGFATVAILTLAPRDWRERGDFHGGEAGVARSLAASGARAFDVDLGVESGGWLATVFGGSPQLPRLCGAEYDLRVLCSLQQRGPGPHRGGRATPSAWGRAW